MPNSVNKKIDEYFEGEVYCDVIFNSDPHTHGDLIIESLLQNFTDKLNYYVDNDDFEKPLVFNTTELLDEKFLQFLEKGICVGCLVLSFSKNIDGHANLIKNGFAKVEQGQLFRFEFSFDNSKLIPLLDNAVVKNIDDSYLEKETPWGRFQYV